VGDRLYGAAALPAGLFPAEGSKSRESTPREQSGLEPKAPQPGTAAAGAIVYDSQRFYLHARNIRLAHPTTREPLSIEAPLPADFEKLLKSLGV
jgi:23S rRNA-/tRNA-specific pseudouridylate synthase